MRLLNLLFLFLFTSFLAACGGGGGSSGTPSGTASPLTSTAPATLTLAVGGSGAFGISGGKEPYKVSVGDVQVAEASVSGANLFLRGKLTGATTVVVSDASGQTLSISLTVGNTLPLSTTAPSSVSLSPGTSVSYKISGGVVPYIISTTDSRIAAVSLNGDVLTINAMALGTATVTIRDAVGQPAIDIAVTVGLGNLSPLYTTAPASLVLAKGTQRSFTVGGGVPGYVVESIDPRIVSVSLSGSSLNIKGEAIGTTQVLVRDTSGKDSVTITVTVGGDSPYGLYTSAPATLNVAIGTKPVYVIGGGVKPYTVESADRRIATATLDAAKSQFTIDALALGSTEILIRDDSDQREATKLTIKLTVVPTSTGSFYTTAPNQIAMSTGESRSYLVKGGQEPYSAVSADTRIAIASVSGSTLTITALKKGSTTVQISDAAGNLLAPITVTVDGSSVGGSGIATIDILASATSMASAATSEVSLLVTVKDANNTAVPNETVTFSASSGTLSGANPAPSTDAAGTISTVKLSPGTDQSNRTITVTASAGGVSKSIAIVVSGTTLNVAGPGSALANAGGLSYTVKAIDSGGKPIPGAVLALSSLLGNALSPQTVTTDTSGVASFTYTPTIVGNDTITATGLGITATTPVIVGNEDFAFTAPAASAKLTVGVSNTVSVVYKVAGVGVAGKTVTFSTTRGTLGATTATTDANGMASTTVTSSTAGPVTLSAQVDTARTTRDASFVATTPATLVLQANPNAVLPNPSGGNTNQSTLTATVRDANLNPVAGVVVNFTAIQDGSNGVISPASGTTDANGVTSVQFIPGALTTAANGVTLRATVQSAPGVFGDATLTVNGDALFISIGRGSTLTVLDTVTYEKDFSVYVTDANGAPAANRAVTLSVYPPTYTKGFLVDNDPDPAVFAWVYSGTETTCPNEDLNRNGILDPGEDVNGNNKLEPGLPVALSASSLTTDASGRASFKLRFGKNYALWLDTEITAKALVGGTESAKSIRYFLEMLAEDAKSPGPANVVSPYGTVTSCSNPN
ncbi:MAG: hypothetical protein Fur007_03060 [Rhodoferax sp.]